MAKPRKYKGRLAFDPESGFHVTPKGKRVVTDDEGQTWRYATGEDPSHIDRYQQRFVPVDSTANEFARLTAEHGPVEAAKRIDQHHFEVQPDDEHADGIRFDGDHIAAKVTGHTEAWK